MSIKAFHAATVAAFLFVTPTWGIDYVFETLEFPGATETVAQDINNDGVVVGVYFDADDFSHGFIWQAGEYSSPDLDIEDVIFTGINDSGVIVGSGLDLFTFSARGFTLKGEDLVLFEYPGAFITLPTGINSSGDIVGVFLDDFDDFVGGSFRKQGDVFEELAYPGFVETFAADINDQGLIVGGVSNDADEYSGFVLEEVFSTFNHPDGETELVAVNNVGTHAGIVEDSNGFRSFVFDGANFEDIFFPGAAETEIWGMNDSGVLVGAYSLPASFVYHGFVATPVPETTGWRMVCFALSSVLLVRRRR